MAEVQQQEQEKTNVIDISKFFGGKTLSSADVKVNRNETLKTKPSFIAAPELAALLDVVATSVEDKNNTIEKVKSVERIREREIIVQSTSDSRFQRVLSGLRFDIDSISTSYTDLIGSLKNERKKREEEKRLAEDLQKQNTTRLSKERVGESLATSAEPQESLTGETEQEEQKSEGFNIKKFIGAAAVGLGVGTIFDGNKDGGDPGEVDPNYKPPSGKQFSVGQLKELALSVGFNEKNASIAAAVAMGESGGDSSNDTIKSGLYAKNGETSYGLWQINMTGALGPERIKQFGLSSYKDLYDPVTNARAAFKLSGGSNWQPWSVYTDGKYQQYLKEAQKPTSKPAAKSGSSKTSASQASSATSIVAAAPQQTREGLSKEESSANSYSAVASAKAPKSTTQNEITPSTSSYSTPAMASQPAPRSSGGSYSEGQTIDMSGFSSTNPDNLYLAYALKELNIV